MRPALFLFLLPGLAATDNAICAVLSPLIDGLDSVPGLDCSCVSDGTALNVGGDAVCDLEVGPPEVDGLEELIITFHAGTTVRPCATPATASVEVGITLPVLSSTVEACSIPGGMCSDNDDVGGSCALGKGICATPDGHMDTAVSTAITELNDAVDMVGEVAYDASTNKITVSMSVEAGKTKAIEVPIYKWVVADFFAKVSLSVEGSMGGFTTTQSVDLCMKSTAGEICGADLPKCDGTEATGTVQYAICLGSPDDYNWHELFGAPPITMFPPQTLEFTEACAAASSSSTVAAPPPPPTVTLTMQASGSVADYADSTEVLKASIGYAACTLIEGTLRFETDCYDGISGQLGLKNYDSAIAITITAASVIITAVITASSNSAAAEISDSLTAKLSTAEAASSEMGITIEAVPTVVNNSPESSSSSADAGAIVGAVISVLLIIGIIATTVFYLVKKRKRSVHVATKKGAAEPVAVVPA